METINRPPLTRVVLTGSESVGKTTLAAQLAAHYNTRVVPEFVRGYAAKKGSRLDFTDHGPIALGQMEFEDRFIAHGGTLLLQDTDLVSTVVYCHHYFGRCPAFIEEAAIARRPAMYLLLDIDVPWVPDAVRDRGDRRVEVQQLFEDTLARLHAPVTKISGDFATRLASAIQTIDLLLAACRATPGNPPLAE